MLAWSQLRAFGHGDGNVRGADDAWDAVEVKNECIVFGKEDNVIYW